MTRTRRTAAVLFAAALFGIAPAANADVIIQSKSFTLSGGVPASDVLGFTEFDPDLGTLDSVTVEIAGGFGFQVRLDPGEIVVPIVGFDISRLTGQGFEFAGNGATFLFPSQTNSGTSSVTQNYFTSYSIDMTFDAVTDLFGGDVPSITSSIAAASPPTSANAQRADFIAGIASIGIQEQLLFLPQGFTPTSGISGNGSFILTYNYTPAPVVSVTEPPSLALFALGLAGLGLLRRRRKS